MDPMKADLMKAITEPDMLSPVETARELRLSPKTLANMRSRREGPPYVRLSGGAIRYSRRAVAAWLAERTVTHGGAA